MLHRLNRETGQQLVSLALVLALLLGVLGLVIDVGKAFVHARLAQNAADAAASAAGMVLYSHGATVATNTARYYAGQHGYNNNGTTNIVSVFSPPATGAYAGNPQYIQVVIEDRVTPLFARILWGGTFRVRARATAGWKMTRRGPSVLVLGPTGATLSMNGNNPLLTVRLGDVHVNSNSDQAVNLGNGNIYSMDPTAIVGSYVSGPNGAFKDLTGAVQLPNTGANVKPDPLAGLPPLSRIGLPAGSGACATGLNPGYYANGISTNSNCTLNPGSYFLDDDFNVGGNAVVTGANVFIYLSQGSVKLGGNSSSNLTAPSTGTYAGVLFFQARGNTSAGTISGASGSNLTGTVYMPAGGLVLGGNLRTYTNFIVNTLSVSGGATLTVEGYDGAGWTTQTSALTE